MIYPTKDDLWQALSDSGEIRWLDNPTILNKITSAYYFIGIFSKLAEQGYQTINGFNPTHLRGSHEAEEIVRRPKEYAPNLIERLDKVIKEIDRVDDIDNRQVVDREGGNLHEPVS